MKRDPPKREAAIPWFRDWFGREYLALYPHRDRAEARRAVALLHGTPGLRASSTLPVGRGDTSSSCAAWDTVP